MTPPFAFAVRFLLGIVCCLAAAILYGVRDGL